MYKIINSKIEPDLIVVLCLPETHKRSHNSKLVAHNSHPIVQHG